MLFIAYNILGDYHSAEDVVQEAIIAMFINIKKLRNPEAFDAWMSRIVRTKCSKQLRARSALRDSVDIDECEIPTDDNDREFLPDIYAEDAELRGRLYTAILGLPEKRREAIIMYYYEGLSYKEIAAITTTSVTTVASNITRARGMIKDALGIRGAADASVGGRGGALGGALGMPAAAQRGLASSGSALVISRALEGQASHMIPDSAISAFQAKWVGALQPMKFPAAQSVVMAKNIAVAAVCSAVAVTGAVAIPAYINNPPPVASVVASENVKPAGHINFVGGDCDCGHINPSSATFAINGIGRTELDPQWEIRDSGTGNAVAVGVGYNAADAFKRLRDQGQSGKFTILFRAEDEDGVAVTARRVFELS
jgi:RNA polymerase sigma-70 factor (ECF subfamily)